MKTVKGNLLDTELTFIAHGCNAQGKMGSGVAKAIRAKYPKAYTDYISFLASTPKPLGGYCFSPQDDGKVIINLITQDKYGYDGRAYASLDYIKDSLLKLSIQSKYQINKIAIPKIGAGLGGLDWHDVVDVLNEVEDLTGFKFTIYEI